MHTSNRPPTPRMNTYIENVCVCVCVYVTQVSDETRICAHHHHRIQSQRATSAKIPARSCVCVCVYAERAIELVLRTASRRPSFRMCVMSYYTCACVCSCDLMSLLEYYICLYNTCVLLRCVLLSLSAVYVLCTEKSAGTLSVHCSDRFYDKL